MKALLALHSLVARNHLRRRLRYLSMYLSIYFDWAGTVTYVYLGAFFLILLAYYLSDPATRIPFPVRQMIVLSTTGILMLVPVWWLVGSLVLAEKTPILISPADVHFLPLLPVDKLAIIAEQWSWPALKRSALAVTVPFLIWPLFRLFQPTYTVVVVAQTQFAWLLTGLLGLSLQWLMAYLIELFHTVYRWLKRLLTFILLLGIAGEISIFMSPGHHFQPVAPLPSTPLPALPSNLALPWHDWTAPVWITMTAAIIILTALVWLLYVKRAWEPTLRQSQQVHTLRTLMRARDKRALQRYRRRGRGQGILSRLLADVYTSPNWALAWKNILSWQQINWTQVILSFGLPAALLFAVAGGIISLGQASPGQADVLLNRIFLQELPLSMLILQGYTEFLRSWQDDLQHADIFGLLPITPRQVILSTVTPAAVLTGVFAVLLTLLAAPVRGLNFLPFCLLALAESALATILVAREVLKDPSAATSTLGPERWLSGALVLLAPATGQLGFLWGWTTGQSLQVALIIAVGLAFVLFMMMVNELVLLRSRYGL